MSFVAIRLTKMYRFSQISNQKIVDVKIQPLIAILYFNVYKAVARVTKMHRNTICYHRELEYYS